MLGFQAYIALSCFGCRSDQFMICHQHGAATEAFRPCHGRGRGRVPYLWRPSGESSSTVTVGSLLVLGIEVRLNFMSDTMNLGASTGLAQASWAVFLLHPSDSIFNQIFQLASRWDTRAMSASKSHTLACFPDVCSARRVVTTTVDVCIAQHLSYVIRKG